MDARHRSGELVGNFRLLEGLSPRQEEGGEALACRVYCATTASVVIFVIVVVLGGGRNGGFVVPLYFPSSPSSPFCGANHQWHDRQHHQNIKIRIDHAPRTRCVPSQYHQHTDPILAVVRQQVAVCSSGGATATEDGPKVLETPLLYLLVIVAFTLLH